MQKYFLIIAFLLFLFIIEVEIKTLIFVSAFLLFYDYIYAKSHQTKLSFKSLFNNQYYILNNFLSSLKIKTVYDCIKINTKKNTELYLIEICKQNKYHKICNLKQNNKKLNELMQNKKYNDDMFEIVFYKSSLGMAILTSDDIILDVNNSFIQLLDFQKKEDIIGKNFSDFISYKEYNLEKNIKLEKKDLLSGEFCLLTNLKNEKWVNINISYFDNDIKNSTNYIIQTLDITENKNQDLLLSQKNKELQISNERLENFVYTTSHDMKTPLRGIYSFIDKISSRLNKLNIEDELLFKYFNYVKRDVNRMNSIITDTLNYSKYTKGDLNLKNIYLKNAIIEVIDLILLHEQNIPPIITVNIDSNITIKYDENLFKLIIQNIIDNALKYNDKDIKLINFNLINYSDTEYLLEIEDNGIGIDSIYFDKIFIAFQRLHGYNIEGTGLGLSIVKLIINRHNGRIELQSELKKGTIFKIYIKKYID